MSVWVAAAVAVGVGVLCHVRGFLAGHRLGWHRGYQARMMERVDGENFVP